MSSAGQDALEMLLDGATPKQVADWLMAETVAEAEAADDE